MRIQDQVRTPSVQLSEEERELTMNLEWVYERWERKVKAQGEREGHRRGKARPRRCSRCSKVGG